jgi:HEAT repeat protein
VSTAFERFRYSFFEDPYSAREGLDLFSLAQLAADERVNAEDMLIAYLPDTRAVIGLGELRTRRAEDKLVPLFEAELPELESSSGLVYLAKALWQIRPDRRWLDAITNVLGRGNEWTQRMKAALALLEIGDISAVPPLLRAIDDPEALVRYHAARALVAVHKLPAEATGREHITFRLMSDDPELRKSAKADMLAAIAAHPAAAHRRDRV